MPYGKMLIDEIENSSGDTFDLSHSSLSGTNDENSHPASAISTESGLSVQEKLNQSVAVEVETTEYLINAFDGSALSTGDVVRTLGYYTAGDGGGAEWVKTGDTGSASQTPADRLTGELTTSDGDVFEIVTLRCADLAFGSDPTGVNDSTTEIQSALNYAASKVIPMWFDGEYCKLSHVTCSGLIGLYSERCTIIQQPTEYGSHCITLTDSDGLIVSGVRFDGSGEDDAFSSDCLRIADSDNVSVSNLYCYKPNGSSVKVAGSGDNGKASNIMINNVTCIESGRDVSGTRNGIDIFYCSNVSISDCYVKGSVYTPNNVGIILMGVDNFSVVGCKLIDNVSEQMQMIGTAWDEELDYTDDRRTSNGTVSNCTFTQPRGVSYTSNLSVGENAHDIKVTNCAFDGSLTSAINIFGWCYNVVVSNNTFKNSANGVAISSYNNDTYIIKDNFADGLTDKFVSSASTLYPKLVQVTGNVCNDIINEDGALTRFISIETSSVGGNFVISNNKVGIANYAIDMTGASSIERIVCNNNDFRSIDIKGGRNLDRTILYPWDNQEPDGNIDLYRATYDFTVSAGGQYTKTLNYAQSTGEISVVLDYAETTSCILSNSIGVFSTTEKFVRHDHVGGSNDFSGTAYIYAKPK